MSSVIHTPSFTAAWSRLAECHSSGRAPEGRRHLRLLGQTGLGKTFLLNQYAQEYPPRAMQDRSVVPVLLVPIPSSPTIKGLYQAILLSLGAQAGTASITALRHRAITLIKNLRVEMLMLDEINHVLDRGQRRTQEAVTDAIKEFVDAIAIPTVFAGARRSEQLFQANAQLRSRTPSTHTLRPFDLKDQFLDLQGFIKALLSTRMSEKQAEWMASAQMATLHFYATDGIHRHLTDFLNAIPRWSLDQAFGDAHQPVLAELFRRHLWEGAPSRLNPYCPEFVHRRLNKRGEPYAPTNLDGDNHDGCE